MVYACIERHDSNTRRGTLPWRVGLDMYGILEYAIGRGEIMSHAHAIKRRLMHRKSERLEARVSADLKRLFQEAANLHGITMTDFVIRSAQEAAQRTVQEQEIMRLSEQDRKVFVRALLNPPTPSPRLRAAVEHYNKVIGL